MFSVFWNQQSQYICVCVEFLNNSNVDIGLSQEKKKKTLILDNKRTKILNVSFDDNNDDDYQPNNKTKAKWK